MKNIIMITLIFLVSCHHNELSTTRTVNSQNHYQNVVQPIFDHKCIACHSCYNAPCQLKLTSFEGLQRGAHHASIYDFPALKAKDPTRLFVDAHSEKEWRRKGFYSVISSQKYSLLSHLIDNKGPYRKLRYKKSEESKQCSNLIGDYPINNYNSYMPYGLPGLNKKEIDTIKKWEKSALPGPLSVDLEKDILADQDISKAVSKWEKLLNGQDMKSRLSSRYIYEHLFLANLYFTFSKNTFFRLVRSETRNGNIVELATTYPFDKPAKGFFYRLRPVTQTLVHKSHIPFPLNQEKFQQWQKEFYLSTWKEVPKKMPAYGKKGANPFKTFYYIPSKARYNFFLRESAYHIMTFIKGPVCRGPTALNVINDHFWVTFLDPKYDPLVNNSDLERKIAQLMELPAQIKDDFKPFKDFRKTYWRANKIKMDFIARQKRVLDSNWLWNGNKTDSNALITVYRHYDSAQVLRGVRGIIPKTVWTLDYHVFETIYYNLTAGYNVFGPILHQVNSRLFMELSRISSEDLFLSFLSDSARAPLRQYWNRKVPKQKKGITMSVVDSFIQDAKDEMTYKYPYNGHNLKSSFKAQGVEEFNRTVVKKYYSSQQINNGSEKINQLFQLAGFKNKFFNNLPDTMMLKVRDGQVNNYYTLILNRAHYNVSMMFLEDDRREYEHDHFDIIKGIASSYANLFIIVDQEDISELVSSLKSINSFKDSISWIKKYGLLRNHQSFWQEYKDFSSKSKNDETNEQGWLDLNRYTLVIDGDELIKSKDL